jgi:hypothetical protein
LGRNQVDKILVATGELLGLERPHQVEPGRRRRLAKQRVLADPLQFGRALVNGREIEHRALLPALDRAELHFCPD